MYPYTRFSWMPLDALLALLDPKIASSPVIAELCRRLQDIEETKSNEDALEEHVDSLMSSIEDLLLAAGEDAENVTAVLKATSVGDTKQLDALVDELEHSLPEKLEEAETKLETLEKTTLTSCPTCEAPLPKPKIEED